jgi:acyl dehydratase
MTSPGDSLTETHDADAARRLAEPFLNKWGPYRLTRDPITENDVRRFCEVVEDGNPVYWDEEFARGSRFGRLISPPQSLFAMTFGAWWTPGHVEASLAAQTAALNQDGDAVDPGAIFAICERFGYVVNTVAGQETEYIAPFGPGDGRIKMRSMTVDVSPEKTVRVGKGIFITSITEYRTERADELIGRSRLVLLRYKPKEEE